MHICYLFVFSFGVLGNIGLTFDYRYVFQMKDGVLHIGKNKEYIPNNFFENGIYSLTAIVGSNGSGKTTVLQLMKKLFIEGEPRDAGVDVVVVYEQNGEFYIYATKGISVKTECGIRKHQIKERSSIATFYYSGHFQPYTGIDGDMELAGSYDASDAWMLIKDLQNYSNVDTLHLSEPLYNYLQAYYAQNNYRICTILSLNGLPNLLQSVRLPRYVQIVHNRGGWNAIKLDRMDRYKGLKIPGERFSSKDIKGQALERLIYYIVINFIAENKANQQQLVVFLNEWLLLPKSGDVKEMFEKKLKEGSFSNIENHPLNALLYVIRKIDELCEFDPTSGTFYIDVLNHADNLRLLMHDVLSSPYFLTARFFDIVYSHNLLPNQRLSSGELEMLNLLSRLYDGIILAPNKFKNLKRPRLLLLDEAEIGFHPDWQRQYVKILTEFMQFMLVESRHDFQIVITSHSPIVLSDLPVSCVNFLKRGDDDRTVLVGNEQQTFGENVFNLYKRAFFMENGLIGAFAQKKIRKIADDIDNRNDVKNLPCRIKMIGDEQIRNYLTMKLAEIDRSSAVALLEEQIQQIKNGSPWN